MEYRMYTTPAIVLARQPSGEANSTVWLLTRDLGLLRSTAQAARDLPSKHRYGLQTFSFSTVSVVRGKGGWRVTSVLPHRSYYSRMGHSRVALDVAAKVAVTVRHLIAGEEADMDLFMIVYSTFNQLAGSGAGSDARSVERIAILRILNRLGYIGTDQHLSSFLTSYGYTQPLITQMHTLRPRATGVINNALEASHLAPTPVLQK